jgi:hypothetical protein
MVGGHHQRGTRREPLGDLLDETVRVRKLKPPGLGAAAVPVSRGIQVAVVRVDEAAVGDR